MRSPLWAIAWLDAPQVPRTGNLQVCIPPWPCLTRRPHDDAHDVTHDVPTVLSGIQDSHGGPECRADGNDLGPAAGLRFGPRAG